MLYKSSLYNKILNMVDLYTVNGKVTASNSNMTWRDIHYNNLFDEYEVLHNKFDRWNATSAIQHSYRRWVRKVRVESSTLFLSREDILGEMLPMELYNYICKWQK
jgi:hypothetical protein